MYKYTLIFIRRGSCLLMLNRFRSPIIGKWNGIGGKLEQGESPSQCVIREAYEETGIQLGSPQFSLHFAGTVTWRTLNGTSGMYVYVVDVPSEFEFITPVEVSEGILDWKEAQWVFDPQNGGIANNIQQFLPDMLNGQVYDHIYTFNANEEIPNYEKSSSLMAYTSNHD